MHGCADRRQDDIAPGELLITARPLELVRPGDPDWQYQADARRAYGIQHGIIWLLWPYLKVFRSI